MTRLLIGGYSGAKGSGSGIAVLDDGELTNLIPAESPSWIAWHPTLPVLYAVAETEAGRVHAWSLAGGGAASDLGSGETGGSEPCHLTVDASGRFLITVNYSGGSFSAFGLGDDGRIGPRTDLVRHDRHGEHERQEQAHPHMVRADGDDVLVTDLGGDAIYRYHLGQDGSLRLKEVVDAPAQTGPRHVLPVGGRYYLTAELSGQVLVYDAGWQLLGAVPASMQEGKNQPSELASDGHWLYVANRGPDTVAVFALGAGLPRYRTEVPAGTWPRHITLDGDLLHIASERSHEVRTMRIDAGTGVPAQARASYVPSPTCILPWPAARAPLP
jgi:6-phosphogluconolactonase